MARTAALAILLLTATPALAIQGQATVIDGDTLKIHGERIRLDGIDAPEGRQVCYAPAAYRCGQEAEFALADYIGRRMVSCAPASKDRYGRIVARCSVSGQDIAGWLVSQGHALDWPRYSKGRYAAQQEQARTARRGI
jgi:endonuclease YncB( thermonuclease family)